MRFMRSSVTRRSPSRSVVSSTSELLHAHRVGCAGTCLSTAVYSWPSSRHVSVASARSAPRLPRPRRQPAANGALLRGLRASSAGCVRRCPAGAVAAGQRLPPSLPARRAARAASRAARRAAAPRAARGSARRSPAAPAAAAVGATGGRGAARVCGSARVPGAGGSGCGAGAGSSASSLGSAARASGGRRLERRSR